MNDLYEFGGVSDVIIRCNSDRTIGNQLYKAGQPYTILKDVLVQIGYRNTTSDSSAKTNILANREGLPDLISIGNIVLNTKVCDLIADRTSAQAHTKYIEYIAEDNKIYLPEAPIQNTVYVYYKNQLLTDFTINNDILFGNFISGEKYVIIYSVLSDNICFNFNVPSYGYFSLDIIGKGNLNKQTQNIYIHFPAVSLISNPIFNLVNGSILNAPLQFTCIHRGQSESYFSIGD